MTISEVLTKANLSMAEFSRMFDIPVRTVQDWKYENRKPPEYVISMIIKLLKLEHGIEI